MDEEVVVVLGSDCCADATCLSSSIDLECSSAGCVTSMQAGPRRKGLGGDQGRDVRAPIMQGRPLEMPI